MTELLYLPDKDYRKDFDAGVSKTKEVDGYVVLEKTLFYKEGGGQPADHGKLSWNEGKAEVIDIQKKGGEIRHFIEGDFPEPGTEIHGEIDWERRYKHMRMHTAQHVLSLIVLEEYGATTAGNQIHEDYSRIDFKPVEFAEDDLERIEKAANSLIAKDHEVEKSFMERERVESKVEKGRTNLELIPDSVDPLRVVEFGEDLCPCGGTHVDSLEEIGEIEIVDNVKKGAETERIEFVLNEK